jgi:shikimate kinase
MKIFLLGFMGAGKSTIGKFAARKNGLEFVDLDQLIEEREGKEIREIFDTIGESRFREMEREALEAVIEDERDLLVSTGGGTPCFFDNMQRMNEMGVSLYLDLSSARLTERLRNAKSKRPLISSIKGDLQKYVHQKLMDRAPFYFQANIIVPEKDAQKKNVAELVQKILAAEI